MKKSKLKFTKSNIEIESDGTSKGTSIFINGIKQNRVIEYKITHKAGESAILHITYK